MLLLPLIAVCAVAVWLESRRPVFFIQTRVGRQGKPFSVFKLRTMTHNCDDSMHRTYVTALIAGAATPDGGLYKLTSDPRVTRVGRVLRRLSLDELPQLINVIRGEMSLVGPRPALPSEVQMYDDRALARLSVKPGITGLWQVSGRSRLTFGEMIDLDIRYARDWSPWLDAAILLRTVPVVVFGRGAA